MASISEGENNIVGLFESRPSLPDKFGVCAASCLVTVRDGMVPVRVLNPQGKNATLDKGVLLGTLTVLEPHIINSIDLSIGNITPSVDCTEVVQLDLDNTDSNEQQDPMRRTVWVLRRRSKLSLRFCKEINKLFSSLLRFVEIQDTVTQFKRFQNKELVGFEDLPESVASALLKQLKDLREFTNTIKALEDGFQLLINPSTQFEHRDRYIVLHTIVTLPRIPTKNSFCTVEYLTPMTYKLNNNRCYSGPIVKNDLILVTCPNSKIVLNSDSLSKCYGQYGTLVCPDTITRRSHDSSWLGLSWKPGMSYRHPRTHLRSDCDNGHAVIHLGGRFYLSTKTQTLKTNAGTLHLTPLSIYQLPCNITAEDLPTGFSTCPDTITMTLPIFRRTYVKYIPWNPKKDNSTLDLHYRSLKIPPKLKLNKTITKALDDTFHRINGDLEQKLRKIRKNIKEIHSVTVTPWALIVALLALSLAAVNTIAFIVLCCFHRKRTPEPRLVHYVKGRSDESTKLTEKVHLDQKRQPLNTDKCPDCNQDE